MRTSSTLESLQALAEGGYVSRKQAKKLSWDYRFERVLEHRQQMWALKRTHLFPDLGKASAGGLERKRDITIDDLNQNIELRRLARAFHLHPEELVNKMCIRDSHRVDRMPVAGELRIGCDAARLAEPGHVAGFARRVRIERAVQPMAAAQWRTHRITDGQGF